MTRRRTFRPSRWALILLLAAGAAVAWDLFVPAGPFPPPEKRVILVQRGENLRQISEELQRVGLLRGTLTFHALARLMRLDRRIKAGQYSFHLGITVPELLRAFARGMSGQNLVTIPEGLTLSEVSLLLSNHLGVPVAEFDSLAHSPAFLDSVGVDAPSLEGYLAPDSYEFLPGTSPEVAFRTMTARTRRILLEAAAGRDGLPPGPVCNPGRASIEAVMNPTPGDRNLYFVARGGGHHLFAASYEQHLANIRSVRGRAEADTDSMRVPAAVLGSKP